jgi:hypothetical protein
VNYPESLRSGEFAQVFRRLKAAFSVCMHRAQTIRSPIPCRAKHSQLQCAAWKVFQANHNPLPHAEKMLTNCDRFRLRDNLVHLRFSAMPTTLSTAVVEEKRRKLPWSLIVLREVTRLR